MAVLYFLVAVCLVHYAAAGCCTPDQYEATIGTQEGYAKDGHFGSNAGQMRYYYDAVNKKIAVNSTMYIMQKVQQSFTIQDFSTGMQYTIINNVCNKASLAGGFQKKCIPADAQDFGTIVIGPPHESITTKNYQFVVDGETQFVQVSANECLPMGALLTGNANGASYMKVLGFSAIRDGIQDPSIFTPPDICNKDVQPPVNKLLPFM